MKKTFLILSLFALVGWSLFPATVQASGCYGAVSYAYSPSYGCSNPYAGYTYYSAGLYGSKWYPAGWYSGNYLYGVGYQCGTPAYILPTIPLLAPVAPVAVQVVHPGMVAPATVAPAQPLQQAPVAPNGTGLSAEEIGLVRQLLQNMARQANAQQQQTQAQAGP